MRAPPATAVTPAAQASSEALRDKESARAATDDDHVDRILSHEPAHYTAVRRGDTRRSRASHSPQPVIQNDSAISFTSRQKPARLRYKRSSRNLLVREMSRGA